MYVGGYQGAPVSHLIDVMVEAQDLLAELGVHVETCTNEASAAAMLGASINYPLRARSPGSRSWARMSRPTEDYGEGASAVQERSHAFAMKSSIWLLDPKPDLPTIVRCVEKGFELRKRAIPR